LLDRGIEEPEEVSPWLALIDALGKAKLLTYLDWKTPADEFVIMLRMLPQVTTVFGGVREENAEFAQVAAIEGGMEKVLAPADRVLAGQGLRLIYLNEDSDVYPLIVVPGDRAGDIVSVAKELGYPARTWNEKGSAPAAHAAPPALAPEPA